MTRTDGSACAIIVAAGRSERMGGIDKLYAELAGRPLLAWTIGAFMRCDAIDDIVLVSSPASLARAQDLVREWRFDRKVISVIPGGETRQESVRAGLDAADGAAIVAIHDGARPLVAGEIIDRGVELARETGAALCGVPARDTIKRVEGQPPLVAETPPREGLWLAQTPQCFLRDLLLRAHAEAKTTATDDAALVEAIGHPVRMYEGAASNFKVTTPEDLIVVEALLRERFAANA